MVKPEVKEQIYPQYRIFRDYRIAHLTIMLAYPARFSQ